ncbi:general transcriptional corepressor trfA-like [Apteryx mantelli]|uniref:General transcriptional corepressor trfA-like n=1 Tax=Apteryx mantelli TaxID=2696672 RepID=A0A8B7JR35_9AVES|nr:PREDICTED: uncharacterized protein LOC106496980 [Apteryx mantelli mantelli]XP_013813210.1 PREDICTED: uncharacterized protein LOC106496980 [Apteryx mantelli mantelli]XP_013813211.1 PREDICTED: uncharacterized protein LOC106496980 [Apteryx mantelli mantelli]XP_013813212.1 PREDICTED: uncharacterized protein LOC106496980 [Apteryx mantelli mantelli]
MDPEAEIKKQLNPFYCNICKIWCASALNLQTHFLGFKHKTVEEALKAHGIVKTASGLGEQVNAPVKLPDYVQTEPERFHGRTLEEQLNTCKDSEPALGLNYIIEYRSKDNFPFLYECQLCHCKTGLSNMFMHVYGSKHRLAYLKQHYPEIAESDEVKGKGSELNRKVRQVALTIEKKEGRKQIKVVMDAPVMRTRWQEYPNADGSPSKAKVQHVDTSVSSEEKADGENMDEQMPDSKQDEKNVQKEEKSQSEQAKPDEKVEANKVIESSKGNKTEESSAGNNSECETNIQLQEGNEEVEQEVTGNPEEFTSQEELLGYLQSFEILNEDDASFILKVTQALMDALVEYRQQVASKKDLLDTEHNGEEALEHSTEQSDLTSADISDSDTDYSSSQSAKKSLSVNEEHKTPNFSTGSSETPYENITTEFLNSVRNMNVEEVTATLHKIAAANPAFRGIDIPNVIRILTESGTLRRPSNGSTQ